MTWSPLKRQRVPHRPPLKKVGPYENVDSVGDNARLRLARWNALVFATATVFCLVLVIVGEGGLRVLGVMGMIFGLGVLIPTIKGLRNTLKRMRTGRGLVPGDPYRVEGVDPGETPRDEKGGQRGE